MLVLLETILENHWCNIYDATLTSLIEVIKVTMIILF